MQRVLLATDDGKCAALQSSLKEIGFSADTIDRSLIAIAVAEKEYSIVFIEADLLAYERDLPSQICAIKSSAHRPAVIGVVSRNQDDRKQRCMDAGMEDVIENLIHVDALYETVSLVNRPSRTSSAYSGTIVNDNLILSDII